MSIYEYECEKCGNVNEVFFSCGGDKAKIECNFCGGDKMKKLISASNVAGSKDSGCFINPLGCGSSPVCDMSHCCGDGVCKH